ncbi:cytidylate kinase [Limihaloglobus sulfuriphilus]|uniref:Cytidylate kinase n=1 Tax=Limihaloglobus sulfuriphilus TaxID=1851148 RepID=A0A1Q2MGF6_9BACT|nr:cytidylate kinase family protein [Limihaloglobus sulfuriphilus]AQQ71729.1 cytidylate kinase [Limihaloglobus sulfuriphilus]
MQMSVSQYAHEKPEKQEKRTSSAGPFIVISQQYGCSGASAAQAAADMLRDQERGDWQVSTDSHIKELALETGCDIETILAEKNCKQSAWRDIIKNLRGSSSLDSFDIHQKLANKAREAAIKGNIIIVGQTASPATAKIENGVRIRLIAPLKWRISAVCAADKIERKEAEEKIEEIDEIKMDIEKIYEKMNPRTPAFDLVIDNSKFSDRQIAEILIAALHLR